MIGSRALLTAIASGLLGAFLLFGTAAAQVPGGVGVKPPFVTGDCVKAAGPGAISTTGAPCGGGGGSGTVTSVNVSGGTTGLTFSGGPVTSSGTITAAGTLSFANGGTGQTAYTDGQLLIGNTATGGLSLNGLTAGANITITPGNGSITIAATGGSGSGCVPAGSATSVLTDNGAGACTSNPGFKYATGTATLGTAGSLVGSLALQNATSGTLTLAPPTGALGTVTVTVPALTDTLVNLTGTQTLSAKTLSGAITAGTFTASGGADTFSPANANVVISPTGTGVVTISPATAGTINNMSIGATTALTGRFTTVTSTIATGTAPLTVTSTTNVPNLNASSLGGATFAAPGPIGSTTASTGAFTTLSASSTVSGTGFSTYLASPPAIGGTVAAAGAFTTLSASSTVSGTGFSTYLASPPPIGSTAPSTGKFSTLTVNTSSALTAASGTGTTLVTTTGAQTSGNCVSIDASGNHVASGSACGGGGGGGNLTWGGIKTANFTATANSAYGIDTITTGAFTMTLPATPTDGDAIRLEDARSGLAINNLTVARNGNNIMNLAEDMSVRTTNAAATLQWSSTRSSWIMY